MFSTSITIGCLLTLFQTCTSLDYSNERTDKNDGIEDHNTQDLQNHEDHLYNSKNNSEKDVHHLLEIVYWETKPFIFTNAEGQLDGIIPTILEEAEYYCLKNRDNKTKKHLAKYVIKMDSRKSFYDEIRSDFQYGVGKFENISDDKVFWAPIITKKNKHSKELELKIGVKAFQLIKSNEIAVIVPRSYISLPQKMFRGIYSCKQIFIIAFLMAALASMGIWFIEHLNGSNHFDESFIKGVGTGMWWSLVSMTTVGYGDITLKSPVARFFAVFWLFIGLMIACLMTATMTDVVSGIDLNIHGKKVSVLADSFEEKIASNDYGATVVTGQSYEEVVELVRKNKVFAAMINADVVAWHQDTITNDDLDNPLRVIETLPANLYVNCYVSTKVSEELKEIFRCMYHSSDEIYKSSIEGFHRYCHKEILYIGPISEFFNQNAFVQVLTYTVLGLLSLGVIYEILRTLIKRNLNGSKDSFPCRTLLSAQTIDKYNS